MEATTSKEGGLNERGPKAIAHEMGLQVSHGVHSEVGGIQCGGIHQGEECNLDCPELSGTETPFDREEFLSARLFRFHGGDGQTIRAGIHLAAGAGGAAFGGAEHGVGASAAFRRLLTGPFEGLTEISPRLCRGSFNYFQTNYFQAKKKVGGGRPEQSADRGRLPNRYCGLGSRAHRTTFTMSGVRGSR